MCQCFNNFLQASWPLALVLLHRTKKTYPPNLVSDLYYVAVSHENVCRCGLGRDTEKKNQGSSVFNGMPLHPDIHNYSKGNPTVTPFNSAQSHSHCMWAYVSACVSVCIWYAGANRSIRSSGSDCVEKRMLTVVTGC